MIWVDVDFVSFDEFGEEISWIKGGPGIQTGETPGTPQTKTPEGECFAPNELRYVGDLLKHDGVTRYDR